MSDDTVYGRKGGKGGGGGGRTPVEDPNTLRATNIAQLIDLVSEGPIEGLVNGLQSVYFDETPVQNSDGSYNFQGVTLETRDGYPEQDYISGIPGVETEHDVGVLVRNDTPVTRTINNPEADAVRIRMQVPRLTYQDRETGDLHGSNVRFSFHLRTQGSTGWTSMGSHTINGKTTSPYQRDYRVPLSGSGPWELKVERDSPDNEKSDNSNDTYWASYTTLIDARLTYPDSALIGIQADSQQFGSAIPSRAYRIRGRIIDVPNNYDPKTRKYSGFWNGAFKKAWTDNPSWIYLDVLKSSRYGAGQTTADKWALYEIAKYCDEKVPDGYGGVEPRFTCNVVINTRKEAFQVIDSLSSVFRGMTYWASNQVMPVADRPKDSDKLFNYSNVSGGFEYSGTALKARHSVVLVSWNDPEDFNRQTIEVVEDAESIEKYGWNQKDVTAFGCASRGQAHRLGKWILYTEKYETETVSFTTGSDAYDLRPGDIIKVSDPAVAGERLGGRVKTPGTRTLVLDKYPDVSPGSWVLDIIMPNGALVSKSITSVDGDSVTLASDLPQAPVDGAVWVIRSDQVYPRTFRVLSVSEKEGLTFEVTGLEHYPGKYNLVEDGTPLPDRPDSLIPKGPLSSPYQLNVESYTYLAGGQEHQGLNISWTASDDPRVQQYMLEVKGPTDTAWTEAYTGAGLNTDIRDAEAGAWEARVRGRDGVGRMSPWTYLKTNVSGLLEPLAPTYVDVSVGNFMVMLYPQGGHPGTQWEFWRSNAALETSKITSNAVKVATGTSLSDGNRKPGTTYYYYVRGVNVYGVSDWYPVQAETTSSPQEIMEVISKEIKKSDLWPELEQEIDKIPGIETGVSDLENTQQEIQNKTNRIDQDLSGVSSELETTRTNLQDKDTALEGRLDSVELSDTQTATELDDLNTRVQQNKDDLQSTDDRLGGRIDSVKATGDKNTSDIQGLETITQSQAEDLGNLSLGIQQTQDDLQSTDDQLTQRINDADSAIVSEIEERKTEDSTLRGRISGISAGVEGNSSSIQSLERVMQEGDELDAIIFESLNVETANRRASIRTEEQVRIAGDEAQAVRSDSLEADIGEQAARITTVDQARADGDSALSSQIGELSAKVNALPQFASGFEAGADFDQWVVDSGSLSPYTDDVYAGLQSAELSGSISATIPSGAADSFGGYDTTIRVSAKQNSANPSGEISVRYAPSGLWETFAISSTWETFEFSYAVPEGISGDALKIKTEDGKSVFLDAVSVKRVAGEILEVTAAIQDANQARADGDSALTQRINNLTTTVGDNTSSISQEAQTRANETQALTQKTNTLRADVDGNASEITSVSQAVTDAESSLSSRVTGLGARTGTLESGLTSESAARTNADEALGSRIDTVSATAGKAEDDALAAQQSADNAADIASSAAGVAEGKGKVLIQSEPPADSDQLPQNLWIDTTGGSNTPNRWNGSAWEEVTDKAAKDAADAAAAAQSTADSAANAAAENSSAISSEKTARVDADAALGSRIDTVTASAEGNETAIQEEATARTEGDSALGVRIDTLTTEVGDNTSAIVDESKARSDFEYSMAEQISGLTATGRENSASIRSLERVTQEGDELDAVIFESLNVETASRKASIRTEEQVRVTETSALASRAESLEAQVGENASAITQEITSRVDEDEALGLRIDSVEVATRDNESAISSEQVARANADEALGSRVDEVKASAKQAGTAAHAAQISADEAASDAADASGLAGSKGKVLVQGVPPGAQDQLPQNLWIDTTGNRNTPHRWNGSTWEEITDKAAKDAADAAAAAQSKADEAADSAATNASDISTERTARADSDSALGVRIDGVVSSVGENTSAINDEASTRADQDSALSLRINSVSAEVGNNRTAIQGEVQARADEDEALGLRIDSMRAGIDKNTSDILTESQARADADSSMASTVSRVEAKGEKNRSSIQALERVSQEGDELDAIIFESLNVETANRQASIRTEEQVRISESAALASRADSLQASIDDTDARITSESQARTDGDSILSSQIGELSAKVDALPQFTSGFEDGDDIAQWVVASSDELTVETGNIYAGLQSARLSSTASNPLSSGSTGVTHAAIPAGATSSFSGFELTIRVSACQPTANASAEFAVAYSTNTVGNSGWHKFTPTDKWQVYEFSYVVPEGAEQTLDYIGIWADTSGGGGEVLLDAVNVKRVAGEILEITSAIEEANQARVDGDEALSQRLNSLASSVGDNASEIQQEAQTRANETQALSSTTSALRSDVDGNSSSLTTLEKSVSDTESALSSRIDSLGARTGANESAISSEENARTTADEALSDRVDVVSAEAGDVSSRLDEEVSVRASETGSNALAISTLSLSSSQQKAAIQALQRLRQEEDEVEAVQFESINVESASRRASVRTEQQARVEENSVLSSRIDTVQVELGEDLASVQQQAQASIDSQTDRINAMWTLRTDVNGLIGGMGLANDGQTVDMAFRTNTFTIAPPGLPNDAVNPFMFKGSTTYLKEAMVETLTFDKLTDGAGTFLVKNGKLKAEYLETKSLTVGNITGLGSLATEDSVDYGSIQGTKPPSNADKTSDNTSKDSDRLAGSWGNTVVDRANRGNSAKSRVDNWTYSGTTRINGGRIQANTVVLTSSNSSGRVRTDHNGMRVYDGRGRIRVKIGKL